ncbi:MAG: hypothetical protein M0P47_03665 [Bacteroidales bacterium]|nr:hypothetical protein [Bacteroidales bacterium]
MRKIALTHIEVPESSSFLKERNCFSIALGNGVIAGWSNDRLATDFMVKINLELNYKLVTLNQILIETYSHYRKVWFYVTNFPDHTAIERAILSAFSSIDRCLDLATTRGHFPNGNHMVFRHLFSSLDSLDEILADLQKIEKYCKHYVEVRMLQVFRDRVGYVRNDLKSLGQGEGNVEMRTGPVNGKSISAN